MEYSKPWQCSCRTSSERLRALQLQGHLSDITITTPGHKEQHKAHSLILKMCSPVLENLINKEMGRSIMREGSATAALLKGTSLELSEELQMLELFLRICYGDDANPFLGQTNDLIMLKQKYKIGIAKIKHIAISFTHQGKHYNYRSKQNSILTTDSDPTFECVSEEETKTTAWQSQLNTSKERLNALCSLGYLYDLTITFTGRKESFKVHKLVLSMCSPVFEQMLYGPMRSNTNVLDLPFDNPQVIYIIINHCYETNLAPHDIPLTLELALEVYQAADKYMLEYLMHIYAKYIEDFVDENNFLSVWDFGNHFGYSELVEKCVNVIQRGNPIASSKILFELEEGDITMLMERRLVLEKLLLQPVWRQPEFHEPTDELVLGLKGCGMIEYRGMVSDLSVLPRTLLELSIAIGTDRQACRLQPSMAKMGEILPCLDYLCIHIVPEVSPRYLSPLPFVDCWGFNQVYPYMSSVGPANVDWICKVLQKLQPRSPPSWMYRTLTFPCSDLTAKACELLLCGLVQHGVKVEGYINVSSCHYTKQDEDKLKDIAYKLLNCKFDWYKDDCQFATWVHW